MTSQDLCGKCEALNLPQLVRDLDDCGSFPPVSHHSSYSALVAAALAGCRLCQIFQASIVGETAAQSAVDHDPIGEASPTLLEDDRDGVGDYYAVAYSQWGMHYQRGGQDDTAHDDDEDPLDIWDNTYVRTRWCSMTGQTENLPGRVIPVEHDFGLYKKWIWDCSRDHEACGCIDICEMPSRVLELETSDDGGRSGIKLIETRGRKDIYVALSHCWGKTNKPVTTALNYDEYLKSISMETLPPTFQDAVTATRKLGFRYLWIDCFCIIQDSKEDWERECSQMARIFANAAVTIAGPEAANSDAGFLFPRPSSPFPPVDFALESPDGTEADTLRIVAMSPQDVGGDTTGVGSEGDAPLRSRAWVLQERLLSTRNLYFGRRQAYFECREANWAEGSWTQCVVAPFPRGRTEFNPDKSFNENVDNWYSLAGYHYNECGLSVVHDKLPALSGLASKFHTLHGSTYAAGVWLEDFPRCLAWKKTFRIKASQSWKDEPPTVRFVNVPTWSWGHIKGLVVWWEYRDIVNRDFVNPTLELLSHNVKPQGVDKFGAVSHGRLTLRGRLEHAIVMVGQDSPWDGYGPLLNLCNRTKPHDAVARFFPDESEPEAIAYCSQPHAVVCLQIGTFEDGDSVESANFWLALVLVPFDSAAHTYKRIGLAVRSKSPRGGEVLAAMTEWFDTTELNVINLV